MTSSADRAIAATALALALFAGVAAGDAPPGAPDAGAPKPDVLPSVFEQSVRREVASRWSVPEDQVALEWTRAATAAAARLGESDARVRLLGGDGGWFTVVAGPAGDPLALRLHAGVSTTVQVATRAMAVGERLGAADIGEETRVRFGPPAAPGERQPGVGWEVRRPVRSGEPLAWPAIAPPAVIENGKPVSVLWERGGVRVRLDGVALGDARLGDVVGVRVQHRQGRLSGIAVAPGVVRLDGKEQP